MSSFVLHLVILWGVVAVAVAFLLIAPRLGLQLGGLRYAGVFGFIGAAFGVIVGMTTFLASQHYAKFRETAENEATGLGDVVAMTGPFSPREGLAIHRQIYCYATDVINQEWPRMEEDPNGAAIVDGRERAVYLELLRVGRDIPEPANWYSNAVSSALEAGRNRQLRLLLGQSEIPSVLWILIYLGAGIMVLFAFFFHRESLPQMAGMLATVVVMLTAITGVLSGLDMPTEPPLALEPDAMSAEQQLLAESVHSGPTDPASFCRALPTAPTAQSALG